VETKVDFVGVSASMPGTPAFTMAAFKADEVPPGTRLYTHPVRTGWQLGDPPVKSRRVEEFIVAYVKMGYMGIPNVSTAFYSNEFQISREGDFLTKGWYVKTLTHEYLPLLREGDVFKGWMELPQWKD
jgi:hypothetical protein